MIKDVDVKKKKKGVGLSREERERERRDQVPSFLKNKIGKEGSSNVIRCLHSSFRVSLSVCLFALPPATMNQR